MWLFLAFLAVPLIEIALFIQIGGVIGLGWTLLIVVATAILGATMVRNQGALAMNDVRQSFNEMRDPGEPLAHGAMILFAGALLLTPGFFTDALGFSLLVPPIRRAVFQYARTRVRVQSFSTHSGPQARHPAQSDTIDGQYEDLDAAKREQDGPSGWTKH